MVPEVSSVIIHYGSLAYTEHVVGQLAAFAPAAEREIVVVDNAAEQSFPAERYPEVCTVRLDRNHGYGYACNRGAKASSGRNIFILNNDLDFPEDPLPQLLAEIEQTPLCGAVGPRLRFPDGRFQLSWAEDPSLVTEFRERRRQQQSRDGGGEALQQREEASRQSRTVDWITGACMLIPRAAWDAVGGFDEKYFFYFEDTDLCRRLRRAGYAIRFCPDAEVVHFHGGSADPISPRILHAYREGQLRYYARYNSPLSFYLLKRYLLRKFAGMEAAGDISRDAAAELRDLISGVDRAQERRDFLAAERGREQPPAAEAAERSEASHGEQSIRRHST